MLDTFRAFSRSMVSVQLEPGVAAVLLALDHAGDGVEDDYLGLALLDCGEQVGRTVDRIERTEGWKREIHKVR
ncbi:MAG: hypothetical protein AUG44_07785 [Actinobacteria bacterium 13_1_20CM_3_71_11]|nr:MAG: hypothetical protein AUG44_07785 [Actinobacteria bacterium 13_1_20CM_3_71_11]